MIDTILVSYSKPYGQAEPILLVGRKRRNQSAEIINAFQGYEAIKLYERLTGKKEETPNEG